ncbi:RDD family protein [Shewanella loihica]|uniref:RDD domain containing protein n=1 Tax=Shewanella loihica (strain ATCC BAA-1088 / PV-4) TaxID=323850 RepID=A3QFJ9_SHELP|nr:RDD domain containing protein [Shewanella loihica PV-4]
MPSTAHQSASPDSAKKSKTKAPNSKDRKTKDPKSKDPKTIVTPFAFHVAPELLYTPLASPLKRGLAMLIDGLLISVLAEQAGALFILLVGLTLVIERRSHQLGKALKWGLYLAMLLMTIWVTSDNIISYGDADKGKDGEKVAQTTGQQAESLNALKVMPQIIALSLCEEASCADEKLTKLLSAMDSLEASDREKVALASQLIDELSLPSQEKQALMQRLKQAYPNGFAVKQGEVKQDAVKPEALQQEALKQETVKQSTVEQEASESSQQALMDEPAALGIDPDKLDEEEDKPSPYSLLEWAKGILNDLGLGFGWAAFYFTIFTAWFDGQTLGKKLLNIRVVPLDASSISLWDAFGRYGGYGAGFATGLLGFLQIYWDANRQAIQDKISETVVVDLSKPREIPAEESSPEVYGGA